jgi:hypothetical protein
VSEEPRQSPDLAPLKLVFVPSEQELAAFRKLVMTRLYREIDDLGDWGAVFLVIFVIGLVVYAAYVLRLFDLRSLKPVLVTAYAAFAAGASAYAIRSRWQYRRLIRAYYGAGGEEEWEYSFDATGMIWRIKTAETRLSWHALRAVEDNGTMVLLWLAIGSRSSFIPARVFENAAARAAFVETIAARIAAARGQV